MENLPVYCDKIKTSALILEIGALDISATAKLVAVVMHTVGVTDVTELVRLTGLERRTIQRAKMDYAVASENDNRDKRVKNDATLATNASNLTSECDKRVKNDVSHPIASTCADITTRANKESSSKILIPSEVKEVSEVGAFSQNAKTPNDVSQDVVSRKTKAADRGSRLPNDFVVPIDWIDWTRTNCPGSTPETAAVEALKFTNHFTSVPGVKGRKLDWKKTWQNWSMTAFSRAPLRPTSTAGTGNAPWVDEKIKRQRETMKWAKEAGLI